MKNWILILIFAAGPISPIRMSALAAEDKTAEATHKNVRFKAGKDVNFEELLIQGQLKRPEIAVVTGNEAQGTDGLLRLREDFLDRMAADFGEAARGETP